MPNGFITLTVKNTPQPTDGDFAVEQIACYVPSLNGVEFGSIVILVSGAEQVVSETVEQIRELIATEKGTNFSRPSGVQ